MITRLTDQLANDKSAIACWCGFSDPQLNGHIARLDFDVIVLDGQHGFHDERSALSSITQILQAGKSPLYRIPTKRWDMCERMLDFGILGVVAPMVNDADDAAAFVKATKYPKLGERSYSPRYAASMHGVSVEEYLELANSCTLAYAQIETKEAYDNLDSILAVEGLDGVLMGPSDFSIFVTGKRVPDPYGPETVELTADIAKRARVAGKHAAAFTLSQEHANLVHSQGYRLISVAMDSTLLASGASQYTSGLDF